MESMPAHCEVPNMFGGDEWNARAYGSLSIASSISAHIKSKTQILALRKQLVNLNTTLDEMFADVRAAMEGKLPALTLEEVTPETIAKTGAMLKDLDELLTRTYLEAKRAGLTNRTVMAGQLEKLREHIDELQDLREWLQMTTNFEEVKAKFERAEREAGSGQVFDLSKVR